MLKQIFIVILCTTFSVMAQENDVKQVAANKIATKTLKDTGWVRGGFFNTNISNTTFSNWAQGGTNNTALIATASLFAIYHPKSGNSIWENYLDLAYGVIRNGGSKINDPSNPNFGRNNPFVKNEDKLVFTSKYGRKLSNKLNYSTLLTLNTQMFPGWAATDIFHENSHISNFLAQGFGYLSVGIDYKPNDNLSFYFSPITAKYTIVREQRLADLGLYGVRPAEYSDTTGGQPLRKIRDGETFKKELGWYTNIFYKKDVMKNVNFQSRLELFNNYKSESFLKLIDVNWQNSILMKVNKYISVSLINQILYDHDVDVDNKMENGIQRRLQVKNFFGIGFSAKFGDKL